MDNYILLVSEESGNASDQCIHYDIIMSRKLFSDSCDQLINF